ncbi:MAG TPA: zinc metalloprotease HtpX [Candidatus Nanoarchaeia archaeon]|nr:zinc metalloprotease HtpX [Candidatus Nanoarchaeia archaeon]
MINQVKTALLLGALTGLLLLIGNFWGTSGLVIGLIFAVVMNFGAYFFSDRIALAMYRAKPATEKDQPELYKIIREVTHLANVPMPKVYIIPSESPNAFATGRNPQHAAIAATQGILNLLSREELKGVIAHEIAHIKNRDILIASVAATIAGVISFVANMAQFSLFFGGDREGEGANTIGILILAILTPIIAMIIQLAISRSREYLADDTGAKIIKNPGALAEALSKLDASIKKSPMRFGNPSTAHLFIANPFSAKGIASLLSTHPPMEERVRRLRAL